jgi:hypothetical protein
MLSVDRARARAAAEARGVVWRGNAAANEDEAPFPICAAPVMKWSRHPRMVCGVCVGEAVDRRGRSLKFSNTELLGHGFAASLPDGTEPEEPHVCFIRGVRCHASEARFGGIVVEVEDKSAN